MEHVMSDFEIVREFRNAKNKGEQIKILMDETFKSRAEICEILEKAGEDVHWYKPRKKPEIKPMETKAPTKVCGLTPAPDEIPEVDIVPALPEITIEEEPLPESVLKALKHSLADIVKEIDGYLMAIKKAEKERDEIQKFIMAHMPENAVAHD